MPAFTTRDGRNLHYAMVGEGDALVCHPGGPGFTHDYLEALGGLDRSRRLILLDPRGTGSSDAPADPAAYTFDDYVADLGELQAHLAQTQIDLLGHSHGSMVAALYAARHPDSIGHLVLVATGARFHEDQVAAMNEAIQARAAEPWFGDALAALQEEQEGRFDDDAELGQLVAREMPFYFARFGESERAYLERALTTPVHGAALACFNGGEFMRFDLRPELPQITAPALVIAGQEDFILGPAPCKEVADGIANARLEILADVGHMPWAERPEPFAGVIEEFLADASRAV